VESASHSFAAGKTSSKSTTHAGQNIPLLKCLSRVNFGPHGQVSGAEVQNCLEYESILDLLPVSVSDEKGASADAVFGVSGSGMQQRSGRKVSADTEPPPPHKACI